MIRKDCAREDYPVVLVDLEEVLNPGAMDGIYVLKAEAILRPNLSLENPSTVLCVHDLQDVR
jgi:hypothetical protein